MAIKFEEGVATISLAQLKETLSIAEFDGSMPKAAPIMHFDLIDRLMELSGKTGVAHQLSPLVIKQQYCKKRKDADDSPSNYHINRIAGKIYFDMEGIVGQDKIRPGIAFVYVYDGSLKGIQLAFGEHVMACDNNTIFGKFTYSTNASLYRRTPFEEAFQLLSNIVQRTEAFHNANVKRLNQLNEVQVTEDVVQQLVGDLYIKATRRNDGEKLIAPLNVTEIGKLVRSGFDRNPINESTGRILTAWDIMNWGTQVLKPENTDMTNLLNDTSSFNDYIADRFLVK